MEQLQISNIKRYLRLNIFILLLGVVGTYAPELLYALLQNSIGETRLLLNKGLMVLSGILIWVLYFRSAFNWDDQNSAFIIISMVHALFWSFALLVAHFARPAILF